VQAIVSGEGLEPKRRVARPGRPQAALLQLGDAATVAASILTGAHIVRVHDVAAMLPAVRIADAILKAAARG
jgi:dihydropteroate synthase